MGIIFAAEIEDYLVGTHNLDPHWKNFLARHQVCNRLKVCINWSEIISSKAKISVAIYKLDFVYSCLERLIVSVQHHKLWMNCVNGASRYRFSFEWLLVSLTIRRIAIWVIYKHACVHEFLSWFTNLSSCSNLLSIEDSKFLHICRWLLMHCRGPSSNSYFEESIWWQHA